MSGTTPTEIVFSLTPFTCLELCAIIETCGTYNVSRLKCRGLDLEFGQTADSETDSVSLPGPLAPVAEITDEDRTRQTAEVVEQDELTLREEQVAMAVIEDPEFAEQLLIDGELEDADDDFAEYEATT